MIRLALPYVVGILTVFAVMAIGGYEPAHKHRSTAFAEYRE